MNRPAKFRFAAGCVGLIGLVGVLCAFRYEGEPDARLEELNAPTKKSLYQLERIGGKSEVMMVQFEDWWSARWRAPNLPYSILTFTCLGAGALLLIAAIDERDPP